MTCKGLFITFEGGDGAGKSTQIKLLANWLRKKNYEVVLTREPGGSPGAEIIRQVILKGVAKPFGPKSEALLFAAARLDHVRETIAPALQKNAVVLCDRFYDSTRAYQGAGDGVTNGFLDQLEQIAVGTHHPDLTLIFDIDPELGRKRIKKRIKDDKGTIPIIDPTIDRYENEDLMILKRRREAFLTIAKREPDRCIVLDASETSCNIADEIKSLVEPRLAALRKSQLA